MARWLSFGLLSLIGLVLLVLVVVLAGTATPPGRAVVERLVPAVTGGEIRLAGLSGWIFRAFRVRHFEIRDRGGTWLTAENLDLNWSPLAFLRGTVQVNRLDVDEMTVARRPLPSTSQSSGGTLPVHVAALQVRRLDLAPAVAGKGASVAATGALRLDAANDLAAQLRVRSLSAPGQYRVDAALTPGGVQATLHATEPSGGLVATLASLPNLGAIQADATLRGPLNAIVTQVHVQAGPLRAAVTGVTDVATKSANLTIIASAPAMSPRPDLSWHEVSLQARVEGPFLAPRLNAKLGLAGLAVGTGGVGQAMLAVSGDVGLITLNGTLDDVRVPGPQPDVLASSPVSVTGSVRLNDPDRPMTLAVTHRLFAIDASATLGATRRAEARVNVPEIAPLASAAGVAVAGKVGLNLRGTWQGDQIQLAAQGHIGITQGPGPTAALLGSDTTLDLVAAVRGQTVQLSRLSIASGALAVGANGSVAPGLVDLDWHFALANLASVEARVNGPVQVSGTVKGSPDNLAVTATAGGTLSTAGVPPGNISVELRATGLPGAPNGEVHAVGTLLGAPLTLSIAGKQSGNLTDISIEKMSWKSLSAQGHLEVTRPSLVPMGNLSFAFDHLSDLEPFLGQTVVGVVKGTLDGTQEGVRLSVAAQSVALRGTAAVGRVILDANLADPMGHPFLNATIDAEGINAGRINGAARAVVKGPLDALAVTLAASSPNLNGGTARVDAAATVDQPARTIALSSLRAEWRQLALRLLGPARISMANGLSVEGLRLGVQQALLEVNGRLSPTLDMTARVQALPVSMAGMVDPRLKAEGTITGDARLSGSTARPSGTIHVTARGLRLASIGRALPAASIDATVDLQGTAAHVDLRTEAGSSHLALTGSAGLTGARALDLRTTAIVDLGMANPLLTAQGRRVRGRLMLDATVGGTAQAPRITGTAQLADGQYRDFTQGFDLSAIGGRVQADGGTIRIASLTAKAGPGTIDVSGSADLTAPGIPVDITVTAHRARPVASQELTADLDANLTIRGQVQGGLTAAGTVFIRRAEIQIPEQMPPSIPVLNVRVPGQQPPPPSSPGPSIALNLTIAAPQQIFIRGRGVDAEVGGRITLTGTTTQLVPTGGFELRRGSFSFAGQTLTFSSGNVSFNGGSLTDPSVDLISTVNTGQVTASLEISGTANHLKITLSSTPPLEQDQILSYLLYGQPTAKLGPLEVAQIAAALAQLSGAGPSGGNPLDSVRKALGLDRLSVGQGSRLQAGRYIARNVYVGAQQSINGTGTQAVVQIDLARGLKLQATAGTGSTQSATGVAGSSDAASVGITYQFNY
jgi:translocation and assembly module TamB